MTFKRTIALGLAGLVLALSSACPRHPPKPSIKYYTNVQEIQNRFVQGENVDVSQALDHNPIPNKLGKALRNYLRNSAEKALETARTIYVNMGANDIYPNYSSLENAIAATNQYGDSSEIDIGNGTFGDGTESVTNLLPIVIKGSGTDNTTLKELIIGPSYFELSDLTMEGSDTYSDYLNARYKASIVSFGGVKVENVLFSGENAGIIFNYPFDIRFEDNTMKNVSNEIYPASITFLNIDKQKEKEYDGSPIIRYNEISNTPIAIELQTSVNAGTQGDLGNNLFKDVNTVVYNPDDYSQGFVGNAWAETTQN